MYLIPVRNEQKLIQYVIVGFDSMLYFRTFLMLNLIQISGQFRHITKKRKLSCWSWWLAFQLGNFIFFYHAYSFKKCNITLKIGNLRSYHTSKPTLSLTNRLSNTWLKCDEWDVHMESRKKSSLRKRGMG